MNVQDSVYLGEEVFKFTHWVTAGQHPVLIAGQTVLQHRV